MDPVEVSPLNFALIAELCAGKNLALSQVSFSTIAITRDSMVALFPKVENERYYDETVKLLRAATPEVYWLPAGKDDDVGFFTAYMAPKGDS